MLKLFQLLGLMCLIVVIISFMSVGIDMLIDWIFGG